MFFDLSTFNPMKGILTNYHWKLRYIKFSDQDWLTNDHTHG